MPEAVLMPALSPTMTHGHIVKWHKNLGDTIQPGDAFLDIETDKAVMEVEATTAGILHHIFIPAPCRSVAVGLPIALIRHAHDRPESIDLSAYGGATDKESTTKQLKDQPNPTQPPSIIPKFIEPNPHEVKSVDLSSEDRPNPLSCIKISPLARKLAQKHNLPLESMTGSGPGGRIVQRDVLQAMESASKGVSPGIVIPLSSMRQIIAQRLSLSKKTIPHFYLSVDFSMDALLALRTRLNEKQKRFSVNDLLVRACALALRDKPAMTQQWHDEGIFQSQGVDLAVAVSISGGLVTPILRQANEKSLTQLAAELRDLVERARTNKLKPQEYQGGGFTLSNLGMFGVDHFQAIINPPQAAILAVGATRLIPVVREGRMEPGHVMTACLAVDHRVLDGQEAAEFMAILRGYIEQPYALLV